MTEQEARKKLQGTLRATRRKLESLQSFGVKEIPRKIPLATGVPQADKTSILEPVREKALACQACRLAKSRHSVVFGEGSLDAPLVFVGEGPGRDEDEQGRPFVGAAGALLTKIIQAMGFKREELYIANVVKCRPPMNRPPEPDEIASCAPFLEAQLAAIQPRVICALGKTAASALLQSEAPMNQMRGKTFQWKGIPLVVTFHPAYLLRNPAAKPQVWADMQRILEMLKGQRG